MLGFWILGFRVRKRSRVEVFGLRAWGMRGLSNGELQLEGVVLR